MLPAIDVHKRRHGASTNVHATAPKRGCRVSLLQVRSTLALVFLFAVELQGGVHGGISEAKLDAGKWSLSRLDVQVGAFRCERFMRGKKIGLVWTLVRYWLSNLCETVWRELGNGGQPDRLSNGPARVFFLTEGTIPG